MTISIINRIFCHRLTKPLGNTALHLPRHQFRGHLNTKIIHHGIALQGQRTGFGINFHFCHMAPIGIGACAQRDGLGNIQQVVAVLLTRHHRRLGQCQAHIAVGRAKGQIGKADIPHPHLFCQKRTEPRDSFRHGRPRGRALHGDRPGTARATAVPDQIRIALHDLDHFWRNPSGLR